MNIFCAVKFRLYILSFDNFIFAIISTFLMPCKSLFYLAILRNHAVYYYQRTSSICSLIKCRKSQIEFYYTFSVGAFCSVLLYTKCCYLFSNHQEHHQ